MSWWFFLINRYFRNRFNLLTINGTRILFIERYFVTILDILLLAVFLTIHLGYLYLEFRLGQVRHICLLLLLHWLFKRIKSFKQEASLIVRTIVSGLNLELVDTHWILGIIKIVFRFQIVFWLTMLSLNFDLSNWRLFWFFWFGEEKIRVKLLWLIFFEEAIDNYLRFFFFFFFVWLYFVCRDNVSDIHDIFFFLFLLDIVSDVYIDKFWVIFNHLFLESFLGVEDLSQIN